VKLEDFVSISELSEKCQVLLIENRNLKEELRALKARLVVAEARFSGDEISENKSESEIIAPQAAKVSPPGISKNADEGEKIRLFMPLSKDGTMFTPGDGKTRKKARLAILPPV
jgi:hypothetical protein